ncbi:hypothetical protein HELRODRAFT_176991 [Helobdella robusta]|uniref:Uncharacterized protein n=1 Tax=Helobdella robusta TaxID=6412 RepID=T1FB37_HELRO|nr:hypothetical protein HELRODRAFT_176991 [Helobdella robusta]ESN98512.1 hypothetical protein HELRODRAFT_176991 [Helobdella robusta]
MKEIDERRKRRKRPIILPLRKPEKEIYGEEGGDLSDKELKGRKPMMIFICVLYYLSLQVFLMDYLVLISVESFQRNLVTIKIISFALSIEVEGESFLAEMYRTLVESFAAVKSDKNILASCTTKVFEFNLRDLLRVSLIYAFLLASVYFRPYIFRIRLKVCDAFYPKRRIMRAIWLYNNILRKRIPMMKSDFDRVADSAGRLSKKISMIDKLAARFALVDDCLQCIGYESLYCLMCGTSGLPHDPGFFKCSSYGCQGLYCEACFLEANKICALCHRLISFDDEDVSEEK